MKRIVSFGDSFTAGLGTDREHEKQIFDDCIGDDKTKARALCSEFRRKNSFTKFLSDKFNCDYLNLGENGCSNSKIMNKVFEHSITSDDFVIISFTSSLRDTPSFFPSIFNEKTADNTISFSKNELSEQLNNTTEHLTNSVDLFKEEYKKFYITDMYDEYYYSMYNQNIILILQKYLEYNNIDYLMIDAFESMIYSRDYDRIDLINKTKYWEFDSKTISSFLHEFNDKSLFEKDKWKAKEQTPAHPSRDGHILFADELYRYINEKK
jgi:hypothetical protein